MFGRDRTVIGRHIRNVFKEGELDEDATCAKFAQVRKEGARQIKREIIHYNLDVIISVGYRVKSVLATEFRKWATGVLKAYLIEGYAINQERLKSSNAQISALKTQINLMHEAAITSQLELTKGFLSIITKYSRSFELLHKYDTDDLKTDGLEKEIIYVINYEDVKNAIHQLKEELLRKGEAGALFGNEKDLSFSGILGSISQTVFGDLAYPSIEEQAAQLLYSIIKGHAFSDGNKRIGSFIFVWFLEQNNYHLDKYGNRKITDNTLAVLALTVAQSASDQRDIMIQLIINLLQNE
ncbi:MAG: type II toxin-antitoxin system death-on-curing family toxin [Crocinitomix sp.]|nr:type II toxin-antitoxin system death-on-curing family toxin [Crocinitomix sp.]